VTGTTLTIAATNAYADKDSTTTGTQPLGVGEAVFFKLGTRSYLSVNDGTAAFGATSDLVIDISGFFGTAPTGSSTPVTNYFTT
jgi:hypothetical protein